MSTLKTTNLRHETSSSNNIVLDSTGKVTVAEKKFVCPGTIIQVVNTKVTDTSTVSVGTSFVEIPAINTSITPTATSSKILVTMYMMGEGTTNDSNYMVRITRDIASGTSGTRLGGVDSGSRLGCFQVITEGHDSGETSSTPSYIQFANYLDSPNTTSACTYKLSLRATTSTTWFVNRSEDDTDSNTHERGVSYCTLMEVAG